MKKGAKLMEDGYLVEISDLDNNYWYAPMSTNSLRQAVSYAAEKVQGMHAYLKVYRDFTATKGAYISVFLYPRRDSTRRGLFEAYQRGRGESPS
jgi:hypothetical protein